MERWGVHHVVTSPHYPQSNGHAEAAVKAVKLLMLKTAPFGNINPEVFAWSSAMLPPTQNDPMSNICLATLFALASLPTQNPSPRNDRHARSLPELSVGGTIRIQDPTYLR